jgi:hypothetical protein
LFPEEDHIILDCCRPKQLATITNNMRLCPADVLDRGFSALNAHGPDFKPKWCKARIDDFKHFCGSTPVVLTDTWHDMMTTDIYLNLTISDKSDKGFDKFLTAHHFLWACPKNSKLLASTFAHIGERDARGEQPWRWVEMIAQLKVKTIVWDKSLDDPNSTVFIVSVDGTDYKVWEKKCPDFTIGKGHSHKFNHGGLKYEIAINVFRCRVVWISGPHRAGKHDKTIFEEALSRKIKTGKKVITDRVHGAKGTPSTHAKLSLPNRMDSKGLANFKARARCRHETFNGRLKFFKALSDTFHHNPERHVHVFEAICVIVQHQMDNGGKTFDVQ